MSESIPVPSVATLAAGVENTRALPFAAAGATYNPGRPSPATVRFLTRVMWPIMRAGHRPRLKGLENLPESGPFLLVSNHSGALGIAEILSFACLYLRTLGARRPLAGFAHPAMFHMPPASLFLRAIGAVPSTYEAAHAALAQGVPLLVFPGGDHEVMRPVWQADRVDFNGRLGFLRLAQKANVPIVPMGIRGSHYTAPVLYRSDKWLARILLLPWLLGVKRFPITLLAVLGILAIALTLPYGLWAKVLLSWLWSVSLFPMTAWVPWSIRMQIGKPIAPEQLFESAEPSTPQDPDAALRNALQTIEARVADLVRGT